MPHDVSSWLARAVADARTRNLPELEPLLESLAKSLQSLRDADTEFGHPALRPAAEPPTPDPRPPDARSADPRC
jgi:hypothetical protein